MRAHKMPGAPFGGKFVSMTNVENKIKWLIIDGCDRLSEKTCVFSWKSVGVLVLKLARFS